MRSMLQALTWDYFRYSGGLSALLWAFSFTPLLIYASLKPLGVQPGDPVMLLLEVSLLPTVIFLALLAASTGLATTGNLAIKPISNLSIASWRLGSGAVVLAIQLAVVIWCHNWLYSAGWPLLGAILFAITTWTVAQPFLSLGGRSLSKMFFTGIPLMLMCVWYITRYKSFGASDSPQHHGISRDWNDPTAWEVVQLLSITALFAVLTVRCVAIDRCGDGAKRTRLHLWLVRTISAWWNSGSHVRGPYRSAMSAQLWYELQVKGWLMPAVLTSIIVVLLVGPWLQGNSLHDRMIAQITIVYIMPILGGLVGLMIGCNLQGMRLQADSVRRDMHHIQGLESMGGFQATRPISSRQYAHTQLKTCACNYLLSIVVWCVLALPLFLVAWSIGQPFSWNEAHAWYGCMLSLLIGWATMLNCMTATASGRGKQFLQWSSIGVLSLAVGASVLAWTSMPRLTDLAGRATIIALSVGVIGLTIGCYRRAYQQGFISKLEVVMASLIAVALIGGHLWCLPELRVGPVIGVIDLALLCVLPWASAPLAVSWNRHR